MLEDQLSTETSEMQGNKQRAERVIAALSQRDEAVIEELVAEDLVHHALGPDSTSEGREHWWSRIGELVEAFPDLQIEVEDMAAEGDRIFCRVTMSGTMTEAFDGVAPSGRQATTAGFHVLRFEDGKVVEWWRLTNIMGWAQQLDILPFGPGAFVRILGRQLRWKLRVGRR